MNINLMNDFVLRKGLSKKWLSEQLGITRNSLNNKLNGKFQFTPKEIKVLRNITGMSDEELITIFFVD